MSNQPQNQPAFTNQQLRQQMAAAFNMAGLRTLYFDMGVVFEELGGVKGRD